MKDLSYRFIFMILILTGSMGFSQTDCDSIQCDCENIPNADKDPGLIALCKYYEQSMIDRCKNGEKNLKCKENARGPNAWPKNKNPTIITQPKDGVDISNVKNIATIKYCNQLISYIRKKGYLFGNVRVPANINKYGYFKEAWAYDFEGSIYIIVVVSKEKKDGYSYKLSVQYENYNEYQFYIYCDVKSSNWKQFSAPCNDCDYDKRFTDLIKGNVCDCL